MLALTLGSTRSGDGVSIDMALTVPQAEAIDRKLDDGYPGHGLVLSRRNASNCTVSITDQDTAYNLSYEQDYACALYFNATE